MAHQAPATVLGGTPISFEDLIRQVGGWGQFSLPLGRYNAEQRRAACLVAYNPSTPVKVEVPPSQQLSRRASVSTEAAAVAGTPKRNQRLDFYNWGMGPNYHY